MSKTASIEAVLSPQELAKRWKVNYKTIMLYIETGEIPAFQVGSQYRIAMGWVLEQEKSGKKLKERKK